MKKNINLLLIITILLSFLTPLQSVNASSKTLQDEKNELAQMRNEKAENNRLTQEAKNSIDAKRNAIVKANNTIEANEQKVENSKVKVAESQDQIKVKTEELRNVIVNLQYTGSSSESVYLDYVFDAESISDLIEREAIIETITEDTQKQLEGLEKLIVDNQNLQVKLADDNVKLTNSISSYEKQVQELEAYIDKYASIGMDYDQKIKSKESIIKQYEDAGCKNSDKIDDCYNNRYILISNGFNRPLNSGKITQAWGNNGHAGMDIGGNAKGTAIYAPASGVVAATSYRSSCGGNIIYIHHNINGKAYTSEFGHLTSINVKVGQTVTPSTIIGTVGGDSSTFYYDKCTTGTHLHYSIAYGHYLGGGSSGYRSWSTFKRNTRATSVSSITNIKNVRGWSWTNRYSKL